MDEGQSGSIALSQTILLAAVVGVILFLILTRRRPVTTEPQQPSRQAPPPSRFHSPTPRPAGFLDVVGESHYQDALIEAKGDWQQHEGPVLSAALVPNRYVRFDPDPVAVIIEPFGIVGYLNRDMGPAYAPRIRERGAALICVAQLRGGVGEKTFIGVVLNLADSGDGKPLDHYEQFIAVTEYGEPIDREYVDWRQRRDANEKRVFEARLIEASNPAAAITSYTDALKEMREYEAIGVARGYIEKKSSRGDPSILDRLTMCLIKAGREADAVAAADNYFRDFPAALDGSVGRTVKLRIEKRRAKLGSSI